MHTKEPWEANKLNWRNEPEPFDVYISGNIVEYEGEDGDDTYGNSATGICIVKGNATSGTIADDNAARIVACTNALAGVADPAEMMSMVRELCDGIAGMGINNVGQNVMMLKDKLAAMLSGETPCTKN